MEVDFEQNDPADFHHILGSFKTTVSLPATARGKQDVRWVVAKPWQGFAANTVTFMLDPSDAQGWIIPTKIKDKKSKQVADGLYSVRDDWTEDDLHLARWLRVETPEELRKKVEAVDTSEETYNWLVTTQRSLLTRRWNEQLLEKEIESRLFA